jgi:hypothetical protein
MTIANGWLWVVFDNLHALGERGTNPADWHPASPPPSAAPPPQPLSCPLALRHVLDFLWSVVPAARKAYVHAAAVCCVTACCW